MLVATVWACTTSAGNSTLETSPTDRVDSTAQDSPWVGPLQGPTTYRIGITEDITTDNLWSYLAFEPNIVNAYVLGTNHSALFRSVAPTLQVVPDVSAAVPAPSFRSGDEWVVEQSTRADLAWSDGMPLTAHDLEFSFDVVRDFELGGLWLDYFPESVVNVDAVNDQTVRITFNTEPGLALWPNSVGRAPFMPRHFWHETVERARTSPDPARTLARSSGDRAPSSGPFIQGGREPGSHLIALRNEEWHWTGSTISFYETGAVGITNPELGIHEVYHGEPLGDPSLVYTVGPYVEEVVYRVFGSLEIAALSLERGDIDFLLNPVGLPQGISERLETSNEVTVETNPSNGFGFLAFNMRREPMDELAFRVFLECLIDKVLLANQVLTGQVEPLDSLILPANRDWAGETNSTPCAGKSQTERLVAALKILEDAGFEWDDPPTVSQEAVNTGAGLRLPDGSYMPLLELLVEDTAANPFAVPYGTWIEQQAVELGVPIAMRELSANLLADRLFGEASDWDLVITYWDLAGQTLPSYLEHLFASWNDASAGGLNLPGYANAQFDKWVKEFNRTADVDQAREIVWQMSRLLAEDRPYIALFTPNLSEAFLAELRYPTTRVLGGIQGLAGAPELVEKKN